MSLAVHRGTPGVGTTRNASFRRAISANAEYLQGGALVQGSKWYDNGNTGSVRTVRAGHIAKLTSGKLVPAVLGPTTADYTSGATEITVGVDTALALVQAVGASGTFWLLGGTSAPTTTATVLAVQVTYSAVNTSTGVITITNIGANRPSGSVLTTFQPALLGGTGGLTHPNVGLGIIDKYEGVTVIDEDANSVDVDLAEYAIGGRVDVDQVINWPANAFIAKVLAYNLQLANPRMSFNYEY